MAILDDNEFVEVEGRYYANPQVSLDESNAFIDNLRSTQQANNQKIQTDTYNLGTEISSNLGGLTSPVGEGGAGDAGLSYFTSRYQTPQTNAAVENLRAVAQANALNQVLANEQEIWKKRYNDAYRAYQKSAYDKANSPSPTETPVKGGTEKKTTESLYTVSGAVPGIPGGYTVANINPYTGKVLGYDYVPYGQDGKVNYQYKYNRSNKSSGSSSSKSNTLPQSNPTVFSGDKTNYLGTGGKLSR